MRTWHAQLTALRFWCFTEQPRTNHLMFQQCQLSVVLACTKDLYWYLEVVRERAKAIRGIYVFRQWPPTPTHPPTTFPPQPMTHPAATKFWATTHPRSILRLCMCNCKERNYLCSEAESVIQWWGNLFWKCCVDICCGVTSVICLFSVMMQAMMLFKLEGMRSSSKLMEKKICTSGSESVGLQSWSASCCFFLLFVLYSRRQDAQYFPVYLITCWTSHVDSL